jgi:hypothetical protein
LLATEEEEEEEEKVGKDGSQTEGATSILSVIWAQNEELAAIFSKNTYLGSKVIDVEENCILAQKETLVELRLKGERSFHRSELLLEPRKIQHLAHLLYSVEWVLDQVSFLRNQAKEGGDDPTLHSFLRHPQTHELVVGP